MESLCQLHTFSSKQKLESFRYYFRGCFCTYLVSVYYIYKGTEANAFILFFIDYLNLAIAYEYDNALMLRRYGSFVPARYIAGLRGSSLLSTCPGVPPIMIEQQSLRSPGNIYSILQTFRRVTGHNLIMRRRRELNLEL